MLASVSGPEEAAIALAAGADIIDLKDPSQGPLGAVALHTIRASVASVRGRRPVSAVTGNHAMAPDRVRMAAAAIADAGVDYVKIGMFDGDTDATIAALAPVAARAKLIAVLFADRGPRLDLLPRLAAAGFAGAMLDTAEKSGCRLLDAMDLPRLRRFLAECCANSLLTGLAGGLEAPDVPRLLVLSPDVLGFRGALCEGGRATPISAEATRTIRALIPLETAVENGAQVDYRLLAARGYAHDPSGDRSETDRVFLRDLVLRMSIGAYAHERGKPQRVRFSVDALVRRGSAPSQDMGDVFSYDIISDGIRMLVDAGHVALVETLAERIAALLLAHPRVVQVTVTVEKLDLAAGVAGVTIERTRETALAALAGLFPGYAP